MAIEIRVPVFICTAYYKILIPKLDGGKLLSSSSFLM